MSILFSLSIFQNTSMLQQSFKVYWRSLRIIYWALFAVQLLFALAVSRLRPHMDWSVLQVIPSPYILMTVCSVIFLGALAMYFTLLKRARGEVDLDAKLNGYRTASLVQWAMLEGATLLQVLNYMAFNDSLNRTFLGILLFSFTIRRPSKPDMIYRLQLNELEQAELDL